MHKRRHSGKIRTKEKLSYKEKSFPQKGSFILNNSQGDRISFSALKDGQNKIIKAENISYEIDIDSKWVCIVRYDDHGGTGLLHRHNKVSLTDDREIQSAIGTRRGNKNDLTWACDDIKSNYLAFRSDFLKNNGLDLY